MIGSPKVNPASKTERRDTGAPSRPAWLALSSALVALVAICGVVAEGGAQRGAPSVATQPVGVEGSQSLTGFHGALAGLESRSRSRVRVMHFGDSNVAADLWTKMARESLQRRFGDGGSGYLVPRGHGSWHRGSVRLFAEGEWVSRRRGFGRDYGPVDGLWGLAGVAVEPARPGGRLRLDLPADGGPRQLEVHVLGRPRPEALELRVDEGPANRFDVQRRAVELVVERQALDAGPHRVSIRAVAGRPRVLGVSVERERGVVYDVFGINGHRASAILHWDEALLRAQLEVRQPDLIVLSYGGNEALDPQLPIDRYEAQLRQAVRRLRALAPDASCLLVGPLATCPEYAARMSSITEAQRRAAPELGCGFWDSSQVTGGHGGLCRWARAPGLIGRDRLHLGRRGYELVGREFAAALTRGL